MDIKKFNKVLSTKIAKAKSFEKHGDIEIAIELWIEISDLTLKASKQPNLDFSYRRMLISKTEQIIDHIKELKSPKEEIPVKEDIKIQEDIIEPLEIRDEIEPTEMDEKSVEKVDISVEIPYKGDEVVKVDQKIIENSDIKNIPNGIKEIEPSKDFKIITPHDPNYVEKMEKVSKEVDMNIYKKPKEESSNEEEDLGDKRICFACGTILSPGTKICTECGTKLN